MDEEKFDAKKAKKIVKIIMPVAALIFILVFILAPIKWYNSALRREAEVKGRSVERAVDFNLFGWLK
jgi:TRAP-type C4-dicarboxylate transport system permease small subunit